MNGGRYYGGIHIIAVDEDSPAAEAGLLPDDTIIAVDGEAMQPWFLGELVEEIDAGQELRLNVLRAADETSDRFTPEELLIDLTVGSGEEGEAYIGISYPAIAGRPDFDSREAGKDVRGRMPRGGRAVPGGERGGFRPPNRTGDLEDVEGMGTRQL
jgi:membrane-associated protease RseP (regulator of RpoE activity)